MPLAGPTRTPAEEVSRLRALLSGTSGRSRSPRRAIFSESHPVVFCEARKRKEVSSYGEGQKNEREGGKSGV